MAKETQPGSLYQPREVGWGGTWEGGSERRGYMCNYGWFMLLYGRNPHKNVKILQTKK